MKRLIKKSSTNTSQTIEILKRYESEKKISKLKIGEDEISFTVLKNGEYYYDVKLEIEDPENENFYKCDCGNEFDFKVNENSATGIFSDSMAIETCDSCLAYSIGDCWEESWLDQV